MIIHLQSFMILNGVSSLKYMKKEFLDHPRAKNSNFEFTIDISRVVETVFLN
jgi:hypothetical protein